MEAGDELILKAIRTAIAAGQLRIWARESPDCARSLNRAADAYSRVSHASLSGWTQALGFADPGANGVAKG